MAQRSWWGWGRVDAGLSDEECVGLAALVPDRPARPLPVPAVPALREPRVTPPFAWSDAAPRVRAAHAHGKAYRDVVRNLYGQVTNPPDAVLYPADERGVAEVLDWAGGAGVAVVPYGGGSSVVGGVEYRGDAPWVSLDLSRLDRVLEVDPVTRAARVQAGVLGPALEDGLRPHGLTLRHFPQSFEYSSVGGWLATRAGGHYATGHTHVDDLVQSMRVVTPVGLSESWRLPASGAGPSPDRLFLGSEGTLGVITEAWLRVRERPVHRAGAAVRFPDFTHAVDAVRAIVQSGLTPANCRLLDPGEAALSGAAPTPEWLKAPFSRVGRLKGAFSQGTSVLVLGFESAHWPVDAELARAVEVAREHGGDAQESGDAAGTWRAAFLRMPYARDAMARMSVLAETFETATTWDRTHELCDRVRTALHDAIVAVSGRPGLVNCRFTHVYPDGPAPYFTVIAAGRPGAELAMWDELKVAAGEVLHTAGATITHHHAVGRDHRPWYDRQRPDPFAAALLAARRTLDPHGVLNPGVLVS
jgi:alkyldihydroxyacetonephosphate synthase